MGRLSRIDLRVGDVRSQLRLLPPEVFQTVCTSPPYFGLRAYGTNPQIWDESDPCEHVWSDLIPQDSRHRYEKSNCGAKETAANEFPKQRGCFCRLCGAWRGELGAEPQVELYVAHIVEVCREIWRVLRPDGTFWLNLGTSYASKLIESEEYDLREDLTDEERAYVFSELANHYGSESKTVP